MIFSTFFANLSITIDIESFKEFNEVKWSFQAEHKVMDGIIKLFPVQSARSILVQSIKQVLVGIDWKGFYDGQSCVIKANL